MRIKCLLYLCVCIPILYFAVGYGFFGICHMLTLARKTSFEQMQGIDQAQEAFTKSLNILLFYPNCDQEIFYGEIFFTYFAVQWWQSWG